MKALHSLSRLGPVLSKTVFSGRLPCLVFLLACQITAVQAGKKTTLGKAYPAAQQVAMDVIGHSAWEALLHRYVDTDGRVNYALWKHSVNDIQALDQYLSSLSQADPKAKSSRDAAIAFWINAYNAVTVRGILTHYPTSSIRNHTAKFLGYNIWHDLLLHVGDQSYSLDTIEHKILRSTGERRIHFAIVCASVSCPRLLNEAYVASRLDEQLSINSRDFFSRPQNFSLSEHTANVSSILKWFAEDFGATPQAGLAAVSQYLPPAGQALVASGDFQVSFLPYDWGLNERLPASQ